MTKKELAIEMSRKSSLTQSEALEGLNAFIRVAADTLRDGAKITLSGFGTFQTVNKIERKVGHPRTGELLTIPAKKAIKFKAGKDLKQI